MNAWERVLHTKSARRAVTAADSRSRMIRAARPARGLAAPREPE